MLNRRNFITTGLAAGSFGLMSSNQALASRADNGKDALIPDYDLPPAHMPRIVKINDGFAPWEVHVDPNKFFMYWTMPDNRAIRYVTGVGRDDLYHPGIFRVGVKKEWPRWTPSPAMLQREPELYNKFRNGMPGGLDNPLGARAMYLYTGSGRDSLLRLHGTNNPRTIGGAVSNGCARLVNTQIVELYEKVKVGTRVVLNPKIGGPAPHSPI
ncbi:MAG: L,D-transpeptidase [Devosiaceae bacterium]|nr:L,D-transpeptidase [Devosiaceae bacterium]